MTEEWPTQATGPNDWESANIWRDSSVQPLEPGTQVGEYVILDIIGQGGCGIVYLAEQTDPVKRRVALKVIKPGMDSNAVIARFEAERQALAVMNHPHIAKVFDGGATAEGRPFFVMEYVEGKPITTYCDDKRLSVEARIGLLIHVCEAIQHAHMKGLVHRDLKPANVLVEEQSGFPTPKVIDFGVAKALQFDGSSAITHTKAGELIGTPEYMSPEQADAEGLDIDTRTDVYSLGVILYELLTGAVPLDLPTLFSSGYSGLQRVIREIDPPKPSTRLSTNAVSRAADSNRSGHKRHSEEVKSGELHGKPDTAPDEIATGRQTDTRTLVRRLRGDLDWIVMKCLEKDRDRRYDTVAALAMELRRHLNNEPVLAGPPSTIYRLRKFARRNRASVTAGAAIVAMLVLCAAISVIFAISAIESEQRAEAQAAEAQRQSEIASAVNMFLTDDLLSAVAPDRLGRNVSMREVLDTAAEQIEQRPDADDRFADKPEIEAGIRYTLGRTYHVLGMYDDARHHLERGVSLLQHAPGADPLPLIEAVNELGLVYRSSGEYEKAEAHLHRALDGFRRELGKDHPDTLSAISYIASLYRAQGRIGEAEPYYVKALEGRRWVLGPSHPDTLVSMNNMGSLLRAQGKHDDAVAYYREAMEGFRQEYGDDHPSTLTAINNMGVMLRSLGRVDEAIPYYREALEGRRRVLGPDHHRTLTSINNMGHLLQSQGRLEEAEAFFREALDGLRRVVGEDHSNTLNVMQTIGQVLREQGKLEEAGPYYHRSLAGLRRTLGDDHPDTLSAVANLGQFYRASGKLEKAEPYYREALEGLQRVLDDTHPRVQVAISNLSFLLRSLDRFDEAEPYSRRLFEIRRHSLGEEHAQALQARLTYGQVLRELRRLEEAETILREGTTIAADLPGDRRQILGDMLTALSRTLLAMDRTEEAREAIVQAVDVLAEALGDDHDATIEAQELFVRLVNSQ